MACNCNIYNRKISGKMIFLSDPLTVVFVPNHNCKTVADSTLLNSKSIRDFSRILEVSESEILSKSKSNQAFDCIISIDKLRKLGFLTYLQNPGSLSVVRLF